MFKPKETVVGTNPLAKIMYFYKNIKKHSEKVGVSYNLS